MRSNLSSETLKNALHVLRQSGVDPESISKQDLHEFASQSPQAQQSSLNQLLSQLSLGSDGVNIEKDAETSNGAEDLLSRCQGLLKELEEFAAYLKEQNKDGLVEYRTFRNELKSEVKFLERLQTSSLSADKIKHNVNSSNLPYYEALWAATKRSSEILTFRKWFYWSKPGSTPAAQDMDALIRTRKAEKAELSPNKARKQQSALVDVVARNGLEWIKVSTITESRILMELAKQGWQNDSDSDEDMEDEDATNKPSTTPDDESDDEDTISLLRIAHDLARASRSNRIRTHLPRITFILPRVHPGRYTQVDTILTQIAATGAAVLTASIIPPTPPLRAVLSDLIVDESRNFTPTLNIDCTILLALVSDISHDSVETQPWYPRAVRQQIDIERKSHLLPGTLYPLMRNRTLTCTFEAAERMHEIVHTIGTDTEKARAHIFVPFPPNAPNATSPTPHDALNALSLHPPPADLALPIAVLPPFDLQATLVHLPPVALPVASVLTDINQSIFLSAWASRITTLSSNATVAKQIEKVIEAHRGEDEAVTGPQVWLCEQSRSLVSKAGRGDGKWGSAETRSVVQGVIN